MAYNFLQRVALKTNDGNLTKVLMVVGTGMIIYGAHKLVNYCASHRTTADPREKFGEYADMREHVDVDLEEEETEEKSEENDRTKIIKNAAWVFGGIIIHHAANSIRNWGYSVLRKTFSKELNDFYSFKRGVGQSLDDIAYWSSVAGQGEGAGMRKAADCLINNLRKEGFRRIVR